MGEIDVIKRIESKVDVIHTALIGDDYREGILKQVERNTAFRHRAGWLNGLAATIGTAVGWLATKIHS